MVNETIRIFCRVKPCANKGKCSPYEISQNDAGDDCLTLNIPKEQAEVQFVNNKRELYVSKFRKVFDQNAYQDQVFDTVAKPVVDKVLEGFNGTVFAYGQTGSGKTYTVTGGAERFSDRGLIPRTLSYIYEKRKTTLADMDVNVSVSYLEIYNESGFDLLDPNHDIKKLEDLPRVSIMEDSEGNIHLRNLSIQPAAAEEEALNLLFLGDTNRMIAETPMNQASTRSHCIFSIHISARRSGSDAVRRSKMHLVDLAGSERVSKTGVSGVLLTEAKYINLSLHHLEQVIIALSEPGRQHVPYRNSLMTSVLRDSLGGNCITSMIATCSVEKSNVLESISTCRFAQRVAQVKNDATINEETDPTVVISRLKREVQQLRDQLNLSNNGNSTVGPLTPDEVERCQNLVKQYIFDPSLDSDIPVGADMRLIQFCYRLLKKEIKMHVCQASLPPPPPELPPQRIVLSDLDLAALTDPTGHLPPEIVKLKQIVQQRDNEIQVLMAMLKKEREKTRTMLSVSDSTSVTEVKSNGGGGGNGNNSPATLSTIVNNNSSSSYSNNNTASSHSVVEKQASLPAKDDPAKQAAFEVFMKTHPSRRAFESQREELKRKYSDAKSAGDVLSTSKDRVSHLKAELDKVRAQIAVNAAVSSSTSSGDSVLADRELRMREQLEQERLNYRGAVDKLRSLRTEIEHLHHLHTSNRAKLMKEFEDNAAYGAGVMASMRRREPSEDFSRASTTSTVKPMSSTASSLSFDLSQSTSSFSRPPPAPVPQSHQVQQQPPPPSVIVSSKVNSAPAPPNIPLTGDGEVDENIAAFLRARQVLMARAAANANRPSS